MKLEQLEQLIEIEKYGSVSKAAKALYLAPSTLSNNLSSLENEIGVRLFERAPVGVTPTSEGIEVVQLARQVLDLCHQITACGAKEKELTGSVTMLITPAYQFLYSDLILLFQQRYPKATLYLEETTPTQIIEKLQSGSANIALMLVQKSMQKHCERLIKAGMQINLFGNCETKLYVNKDHWLAGREKVSMAEVKNEQFINYSQEYWSKNNERISSEIKPLLIKDHETIKQLISSGKGIGIFPEIMFFSDWRYKQGLICDVSISSSDRISRSCLIYPEKQKMTLLEQEIVALIREVLHEISK